MALPLNANQLIDRYNQITDLLNSRDHLSCELLRDGELQIDRIDRPRGWTWILAKIFRYKAVSRRHETVANKINQYILFASLHHLHEEPAVLTAFSKLVSAHLFFVLRKKGTSFNTQAHHRMLSDLNNRITEINRRIVTEKETLQKQVSDQADFFQKSSKEREEKTSKALTVIHDQQDRLIRREAALHNKEVDLEVRLEFHKLAMDDALKKARGVAHSDISMPPSASVSSDLHPICLQMREAAEKGDETDVTIKCAAETEGKEKREAETKSLDESGVVDHSTVFYAHASILKNHTYFANCLNFNRHREKEKTEIQFSGYSQHMISAALDWFYLKNFRAQFTPLQLLELINFAHYIQEEELMIFARRQLVQMLRKDLELLLETICTYLCQPKRAEAFELLLLTELHVWLMPLGEEGFQETHYLKILDEKKGILVEILNSQREHFAYHITLTAIQKIKANERMELEKEPTLTTDVEQGCLAGWAPAIYLRMKLQLEEGYSSVAELQRKQAEAEKKLQDIAIDFPPSLYACAKIHEEYHHTQPERDRLRKAKIRQFYRQSAEMGCVPAMHKIGDLLKESGSDPLEAIKWYEAAANQGCMRSAWNLHEMRYFLDERQRAHWLQHAASLGDHRALEQIAGN